MHSLVTKIGAPVAIAGIAVLGFSYTTDAAGDTARDDVAPRPNIAYVFSVDSQGGTGRETYEIASPGPGAYLASLTANFASGSSMPPRAFSCLFVKNSRNLGQSTSTRRRASNWYLGLNATATVKLDAADTLEVACGLTEDTAWIWGDRPLRVTLLSIDRAVYQPLPPAQSKLQPRAGVEDLTAR